LPIADRHPAAGGPNRTQLKKENLDMNKLTPVLATLVSATMAVGSTGAALADSRKRRFAFGTPLAAPTLQQLRTQLIFPRHFTGRAARIQGAHRRDLQVAVVNRSGQIHILSPFNVFGP